MSSKINQSLPRSPPVICQENPWDLKHSLLGKINQADCSRSSSVNKNPNANSTLDWQDPYKFISLALCNLVQPRKKTSKNLLLQSSRWLLDMQRRLMLKTKLGIKVIWKKSTAWCWRRLKRRAWKLSNKARNVLFPWPVIRLSYLEKSLILRLEHGDLKCILAFV